MATSVLGQIVNLCPKDSSQQGKSLPMTQLVLCCKTINLCVTEMSANMVALSSLDLGRVQFITQVLVGKAQFLAGHCLDLYHGSLRFCSVFLHGKPTSYGHLHKAAHNMATGFSRESK